MSIAIYISVFLLVATLVFAALAFKLLLKRGWFLKWLKGTSGFLLVFLSLASSYMCFGLFSYEKTVDSPVLATLVFSESAPQEFEVELASSSGSREKFEILGDQWQLDIRLLNSSVSTDSAYMLHKLAGRYLSLEEEKNRLRSEHDLALQKTVDIWSWLSLMSVNDLMQTDILSAAFMPMSDGAIYQVVLEKKELKVIAVNGQAKLAMDSAW